MICEGTANVCSDVFRENQRYERSGSRIHHHCCHPSRTFVFSTFSSVVCICPILCNAQLRILAGCGDPVLVRIAYRGNILQPERWQSVTIDEPAFCQITSDGRLSDPLRTLLKGSFEKVKLH